MAIAASLHIFNSCSIGRARYYGGLSQTLIFVTSKYRRSGLRKKSLLGQGHIHCYISTASAATHAVIPHGILPKHFFCVDSHCCISGVPR